MVVNKVVCWTEVRLGLAGEVRGLASSSSTVDGRLVDKLGRSRGRLRPAALVDHGGSVAAVVVHGVLDGLQAAVGEADMVGSGCVSAVPVLRVAKLVATVVILHCVGKYVVILEIFNITV